MQQEEEREERREKNRFEGAETETDIGPWT
jgi:hypothetical protein